MALSPTVYARQTILAAIKADTSVVSLIPADRLYPSKTPNPPTKPFGRYGVVTAESSRYSCWRGGDVFGAYHVFASVTDGIPDPEKFCGEAVDALAEAIDAIEDCHAVRTQLLQDDGEADNWHGIVFFEMKALAQA